MPRASNFLCQQHRPDLIWVPEWLEHPNGATGFAAIIYATTEPDRLLRRLALLFGEDAVTPTAYGHEVATANGYIRVAAPGAWAKHVGIGGEPGIDPAGSACIGIDVRVKDLDGVRPFVRSTGASAIEGPGTLTLASYTELGNIVLRFTE